MSIIPFNSNKFNTTTAPNGSNGRPYPFNNIGGVSSNTVYNFKIISDKINNISKVGFNPKSSSINANSLTENPFRNFNQAYDDNIDKTQDTGVGFIDGYNSDLKYKVYQINQNNGNVQAYANSVRWIPNKDKEELYCENIGNDRFLNYADGGGVFVQKYGDENNDIISWGHSINNIIELGEDKVYQINIGVESTESTLFDCFSNNTFYYSNYGDIPETGNLTPIIIKKLTTTNNGSNSTEPCDNNDLEIETLITNAIIFMKAGGSSGNILAIHILGENETLSEPFDSSFTYLIESVETTGDGSPCFSYVVTNWASLQNMKTVSFQENGFVGTQYDLSPADGSAGLPNKLFQWKVSDIFNNSNPQNETLTQTDADLFAWIPSLSLLYIRECDPANPFTKLNGGISQYSNAGAVFGNKGINQNKSQFTVLNGVRFVNLSPHINQEDVVSEQDAYKVYDSNKQFLSTWIGGGESARQTISRENPYNQSNNYIPGQKVIQVHSTTTDNNQIEDYQYAFGTVLSWDYPDPANPTDYSPMKLVVKRDKQGPRRPDSIFGVEDYSDLKNFAVGTTAAQQSVEFDSKIIPYNFSILNDLDSSFSSWPYLFNDSTTTYFTSNKDGIMDDGGNISYTEKSDIPIPSTIGYTRIRAISLNPNNDATETYPLYKYHIFDTSLIGPDSYFGYLTDISYRFDQELIKIIKIANVTGRELYNENIEGGTIQSRRTVVFEPDKDKMILDIKTPVENNAVENVISSDQFITFELQKLYSVDFNLGADTLEISIESGSSPIEESSTFLLSQPEIDWFVINRTTGESFNLYPDNKTDLQENELIYSTSNDPGYNPSKLKLKRTPGSNNQKILVIAKVNTTANIDNIKNKNLTYQTENLTSPLSKKVSEKYPNRYAIKLMNNTSKKGFLNKLLSVYIVTDSGTIKTGTTNILNYFDIEYGVNDQKISHPYLILKNGYANPNGLLKSEYFSSVEGEEIDPTTINLQIKYSLFEIPSSDFSPGIFVRESHKSKSNNLSLIDIPFYDSPNTGNKTHYSSIIDFRPSDLQNSSENNFGNTKFVPHPSWSDSIETTFYLPRKDRLILTDKGKLEIIYGIPDINPTFPQEPTNSMSLSLFVKPPYVFDNKNIKIIELENKRYTMKDIGKIDKRVKKLEYYTALTLLETKAENLLILDENGNNRFKSGILVDSFSGHGIGDVLHPDYNVSVDQNNNYLRAPFIIHNSKLEYDSSSNINNVFVESKIEGSEEIGTGIYTFPYTSIPFAIQPLASRSISVMPHEVVDWSGNITMIPSSDVWVDETRNPDVLINIAGNNDAWQALANAITESGSGVFGAHWGAWQTIGSTTNTETSTSEVLINGGSQTQTVTSEITTTNSTQEREELFSELIATENQNALGDRITDVSIIPFIREQTVNIVSQGLKPNTRMYVFFNDIDVSEHCFAYANEQNMLNGTNPTSFASGSFENLATNNQGEMFIRFNIPGGTFRTGEKVFTVIDDSSNDQGRASSYSSGVFYSNGLGITREQTILTTRDFEINTTSIGTETRTITETSSEIIDESVQPVNNQTQCPPGQVLRTRWENNQTVWFCGNNPDPLAQTFFVNEDLHPEGIYIDSVDLFFARKPQNNDNLNVSVELRPVNNGYPDSAIVYPGSVSRKLASEVNISFDPNASIDETKTTFKFDYPIYLEPGEHALVIRAQSEDFEVYIAELGENILNTDTQITNQPYSGIFFTSANASTWSPEQNIDLMMVIKKCEFPVNQFYELPLRNISVNDQRKFETMFIQSNFIDFPSCRVNWNTTIKPITNTASETINITPNNNVYFTNQYYYGKESNQNEIYAYLNISASTLNKDVSPVIDIQRLGFLGINNRIESNNTTTNGELEPYANYESEIPRARYISRIVTLEDGFESNNCKVVLSLHKPENTNIDVFAKLQSAYNTSDFHSNNYIKLNPENSSAFDSYSSINTNEYREFTFNLPEETNEPFNRFCIKICMYSSNPAYVPKIKDMRAITVI